MSTCLLETSRAITPLKETGGEYEPRLQYWELHDPTFSLDQRCVTNSRTAKTATQTQARVHAHTRAWQLECMYFILCKLYLRK